MEKNYRSENSLSLQKTLKQAVLTYGVPQRFYCDNGKVFSSGYIHMVCAKLGTALIHSKPYDSPSRGKIERFSTKSVLFKSIQERILHYSVQLNKIPVIIIDEAHLLKNENFFELQIISNFNMDSLDPALFILVAQNHLNDRLARNFLESFNQRISMKFHISPLKPSEAIMYIEHQIKNAGGSKVLVNERCAYFLNDDGITCFSRRFAACNFFNENDELYFIPDRRINELLMFFWQFCYDRSSNGMNDLNHSFLLASGFRIFDFNEIGRYNSSYTKKRSF